jgi:hypothetical protein
MLGVLGLPARRVRRSCALLERRGASGEIVLVEGGAHATQNPSVLDGLQGQILDKSGLI